MQPEEKTSKETKTSQKIIRPLFFVAGTISLVLGAIGIVLPVLPTTPFLLLALACYCRSSERMTQWMLNNKYFGKYIRRYREGKGIPLKTKLLATIILWITISYSALFVIPVWIAQLILFAIAAAVTLHLIKLPTYKEQKLSSY
jgi:uncharacterized membrane protein YbaN (DUF454 family)